MLFSLSYAMDQHFQIALINNFICDSSNSGKAALIIGNSLPILGIFNSALLTLLLK